MINLNEMVGDIPAGRLILSIIIVCLFWIVSLIWLISKAFKDKKQPHIYKLSHTRKILKKRGKQLG